MFERRLKYIAVAGAAFFVLLVIRLFSLQVAGAEHWREEAVKVARRHLVLPSRRGTLFDRHGTVLAEDRLEFDLMIRLDRYDDVSWRCRACGRPTHTEKDRPPARCRACRESDFEPGAKIDWSGLPALLGVGPEALTEAVHASQRAYEAAVGNEIDRRRRKNLPVREGDIRKVLLRREYVLIAGAPPEAVREVSVDPLRYRGITARRGYRRSRPEDPAVRELVGRVGPVTGAEIGRFEDLDLTGLQRWRLRVGRAGIERGLDERLGSIDGWREVDRDRTGLVRGILDECAARHGEDLTLSLDSPLVVKMTAALRRAVEQHRAKGGAFAAVDCRTGDVLVLAQHVTPELDTGGLHLAASNVLPGSVYKTVTALAGLEGGTLDPEATFACAGEWHKIGCSHEHGLVNLEDALAGSCNKYFAWAAGEMGNEILSYWAERLGFGRRTGVGLPTENGGLVPTHEWMAGRNERDPERYPYRVLHRGDVWRIGFGQGYVLVTPLQVTRLMAIVANGGRWVDLSLVKGAGGPGEQVVSRRSVERVRAGLRAVVTRGTARGVGLEPYRVAGKTGTADITRRGKRHMAWFAGYAPYDRPRVAFACYVRDTSAYGADAAGPVCAEFLKEVLGR